MGEIRNCEPRAGAKHEDRVERVSPTLYVRFTSGPDYEHAFLCVDDGEPDMRDVAEMSFGQARLFIAAYTAGINASVSADEVVEWGETTTAMQLLRGPLSKRATSAEFNEWQARDIVKYIDDLRSALAATTPDASGLREALETFAKWAIQEAAFDGASLDGHDIQDKAHRLGLLTKTSYDPEKHGPSDCAEPGMEWFELSPALTGSD